MLLFVLTTVLGVLIEQVLEYRGKKENKLQLYIFGVILFVLLSVIYELIGSTAETPEWYKYISGIVDGFEENTILQGIFLIILIVFSVYFDVTGNNVLSFKEYSRRIREFTYRARDNSVVKIIAGDMDFFDKVMIPELEVSETENLKQIENNEEYRQLFDLYKKEHIKLEILCSHGLEKEQELLKAILNDTTSAEYLYSLYRLQTGLTESIFQQLLRIGKIKTDFNNSVEIRFYNDHNPDKGLRGRFVNDQGIIYRKEKEYKRLKLEHRARYPFWRRAKRSEDLYSVNRLNRQENEYYMDMVNTKWNACDTQQCRKIVAFCEYLYRYINRKEPRFHMALVYVNSYEVARKKRLRKEFPPFGVMYLAACVRENVEWDVTLVAVDEDTSNSELKDWDKYDVIGYSIISSYAYNILKRCHNAAKKKIDVVILAGGYQAEKFSNGVFQDFDANIIFKGEGEYSIQEFCRHYADRDYSSIKGIIYRNHQKETLVNGDAQYVDVDKLPRPARDLLDDEDVVMTDRLAGTELRMVHMLFSRGCIYNCYYCAANQDGRIKKIRYRDKRKIVEELCWLKKRYEIGGFSIIDDCFLTDKEKAIEICKYIAEQKLELKWSLAARVDNIDDEVLEALRNSGCIEIKFGVETGSDELLKKMNKGVTVQNAENAIRKTKEYGINVKVFIITGLPNESDKTHKETQEFLQRMAEEKLIDRISLLRFAPLAGSYIYAQPNKFEICKNRLTAENFDKVSLYRESYDWWLDQKRFSECEKWYEDMKEFIAQYWSDT